MLKLSLLRFVGSETRSFAKFSLRATTRARFFGRRGGLRMTNEGLRARPEQREGMTSPKRFFIRRRRWARLGWALSLLGLLCLSTSCLHHHRRPQTAGQPAPAAAAPSASTPSGQPPSRGGKAGAKPAAKPSATITAVPIIQGEEGIASWYGRPYHGRKTASGEIYNMYGISAAHRTLPFGTNVRVHDLDNGRDVQVRINDRGPFVEGRIIDLSYGAAKALGMAVAGIANVRLDILGYGPQASPVPPPGIFAVQVGAFRDLRNAERLKARIEMHYGPVAIVSFDRGDGLFHRVRIGNESTEEGAQALAGKLRDANLAKETFVVRVN